MRIPHSFSFLALPLVCLACSGSVEDADLLEDAGAGGAMASGGQSSSGGATLAGGSNSGGMSAVGGSISPSGGASAGGSTGSGGDVNSAGGTAAGGSGEGSGGDAMGAGGSLPLGPTAGACTVGAGVQLGDGRTNEQYLGADVTRDGKNYRMITNGWGSGWLSHDISWLGTSMTVHAFEGSRQTNGAPAGYPTIFCGQYSDVSLDCGLPTPRSSLTSLNTAVSWSHAAGDGTYNVAYDVWMGSGGGFAGGLESYFMVWLQDPIGEGPAGMLSTPDVVIGDLPGEWDIIDGTVNGLPIVNYVRAEGEETNEIAFDILDFVRDAETRNLNFPGSQVLSVAIGFEIWQGGVTDLQMNDFCVDVQ